MCRPRLAGTFVFLWLCWPSLAQTLPGPEARQKYAAAAEAARKQNDVGQQAVATLLLGMSDSVAGDQTAARTHLQESSELFTAVGDRFGTWMALVALAELQKGALEVEGAAKSYEAAVAVLAKAAMPGEKFSVERLQAIGGFFGLDAMPVQSGMMPQELFKPILLLFADVMTRDGYSAALLDLGKLDEAEAQLTKAQQGSSMFGGLFDSSLAAHFGDLRRRQWRFEEARAAYAKALKGVELLPAFAIRDDRLRVNILSQLADIEMLSGRTDEALAWNDQALALARAAKDRRREASILRERGDLLVRARRYDAARLVFEDAFKTAEAAGSDGLRAEVLRDHGMLNMMRGKYGSAASQLEKALSFYQKAGNLAGESHAWALLSNLYTMMELHSNAKLAAEKANELARKSGQSASVIGAELAEVGRRLFLGEASPDELVRAVERAYSSPAGRSMMTTDGSAFSQILCEVAGWPRLDVAVPQEMTAIAAGAAALLDARALIARADYAAARARLLQGLAENPGGEYVPAFLVLMGASWAMEGHLDEAVEVIQEAAETFETTIEDIRVEEMLSSFLGSTRSVYFELLIEMLLEQGRVAEAFEVTERARGRAFLRLIGNSRLDASRGADPQLLREADALRVELAQGEARASDLRQMRERYEALLTRLKTSSEEYASLATVTPVNINDIRRELPPATTLVSFFATHWGVHAWLIDGGGVRHVRLPDGAMAVSQAECWSEQIGRRRGVTPAGDARCRGEVGPEEVYRTLFAPLRGQLLTRRLLIVAHGPLHYVPFAALRNPENGRYLIEDFTILYAPSASTLRFLRSKETPMAGNALVFGDPAATGLTELPHAEDEATRVAGTLGAMPLLGEEAMESRLYGLQREIDLVHIAAHGMFEPEHPLFSRLVLAPGEGRDGDLEVHEILGELDLTGVNLVVLAACESGVGKRSGGDDVVGLTRALLYAGTPGVVATLWKIRDDATAALMDEFYCHLRAGDSVADALRRAQLAMLHGREFSAPGNWAAFSLYGDPLGRWGYGSSTRSPQAGQ